MTTPLQTSAQASSINPSISESFRRISGATPTISVSQQQSPKLKSVKESLRERKMAEREVEEEMNPLSKTSRLLGERVGALELRLQDQQIKGLENYYANLGQQADMYWQQFQRERPGGSQAQYERWRNWQEAQKGTPAGIFALQRAAVGLDVNSADYKGIQQRIRNAALNQRQDVF